ncbi:MAG: Gfo/Idh/MocA family oxidoreductase [Verrucomicrobiales bacterium]|nr:Gfo/Idh/MocA family oxidoreductase [Verrucomicrobiales bacterium]
MSDPTIKRRKFIHGTAVTAAAAATFPDGVHSQESDSDKIRIALIGCGGRGTGATAQALEADDRAELWAMGDIDAKAIARSRETLEKNVKGDKVNLAPEREFVGLDAIEKIAAIPEIDVVILTTPPGFRPFHFEAAVRGGKHVFMEKPVAVDAPGVRRVLESAAEAKAKNLKVGVGLNRRHSPLHKKVIGQLHDGVIGELPWIQIFNCRSDVNKRNPREPGMTELEFQVKNWYYFTWLSGDFPVEQSVHEYDVVRWIKQEANPVKCQGQGGRLVRTGPMNGQIYDHFSIDYEFADGSRVTTQHRHIPKCWNWFGEKIFGTKGTAELSFKRNGLISPSDPNVKGLRETESGNSYQLEHDALFHAIRNDEPFNEAERGALSSLFAIMGRMAAYTGKEVTWEEAMNSEETLAFNPKSWDEKTPLYPNEAGLYPIPKPGTNI